MVTTSSTVAKSTDSFSGLPHRPTWRQGRLARRDRRHAGARAAEAGARTHMPTTAETETALARRDHCFTGTSQGLSSHSHRAPRLSGHQPARRRPSGSGRTGRPSAMRKRCCSTATGRLRPFSCAAGRYRLGACGGLVDVCEGLVDGCEGLCLCWRLSCLQPRLSMPTAPSWWRQSCRVSRRSPRRFIPWVWTRVNSSSCDASFITFRLSAFVEVGTPPPTLSMIKNDPASSPGAMWWFSLKKRIVPPRPRAEAAGRRYRQPTGSPRRYRTVWGGRPVGASWCSGAVSGHSQCSDADRWSSGRTIYPSRRPGRPFAPFDGVAALDRRSAADPGWKSLSKICGSVWARAGRWRLPNSDGRSSARLPTPCATRPVGSGGAPAGPHRSVQRRTILTRRRWEG